VWIINDLNIPGDEVRWYAFALTLFAGITMVSTVPYWSGKDINMRRSVPFMVLPAIVLGYALVSSYPPGVLFGLFLAYALSGYVMAAWTWRNRKKRNFSEG
jgi:CDP-diacylglycerol--serine O-phosphatidyltransferase